MIGVGAGLGHYTTEGGYLYPGARAVQIDLNPRGLWQGLRTADLHIRADARAAAESIVERLGQRGISKTGYRSAEIAAGIAAASPDAREFQVQANTVDPRKAILELDRVIPKDWDVVIGGGHYFSIALTHLRGRAPEKYHVVVDFGAIGSGPAGRDRRGPRRGVDGKVVLIEGDGRPVDARAGTGDHPPPGHSDADHDHERRRLRGGVPQVPCPRDRDRRPGDDARAWRSRGGGHRFGLRGSTVEDTGSMESLFAEHRSANNASLWDVHIDDLIASRSYRRVHYGEA